jgi:hypothetical protein
VSLKYAPLEDDVLEFSRAGASASASASGSASAEPAAAVA